MNEQWLYLGHEGFDVMVGKCSFLVDLDKTYLTVVLHTLNTSLQDERADAVIGVGRWGLRGLEPPQKFASGGRAPPTFSVDCTLSLHTT